MEVLFTVLCTFYTTAELTCATNTEMTMTLLYCVCCQVSTSDNTVAVVVWSLSVFCHVTHAVSALCTDFRIEAAEAVQYIQYLSVHLYLYRSCLCLVRYTLYVHSCTTHTQAGPQALFLVGGTVTELTDSCLSL